MEQKTSTQNSVQRIKNAKLKFNINHEKKRRWSRNGGTENPIQGLAHAEECKPQIQHLHLNRYSQNEGTENPVQGLTHAEECKPQIKHLHLSRFFTFLINLQMKINLFWPITLSAMTNIQIKFQDGMQTNIDELLFPPNVRHHKCTC